MALGRTWALGRRSRYGDTREGPQTEDCASWGMRTGSPVALRTRAVVCTGCCGSRGPQLQAQCIWVGLDLRLQPCRLRAELCWPPLREQIHGGWVVMALS